MVGLGPSESSVLSIIRPKRRTQHTKSLRKTVERLVCERSKKECQRQRRSFSSSSVYLAVGNRFKEVLDDGSEIRDAPFFDPAKEEVITVPGKVSSSAGEDSSFSSSLTYTSPYLIFGPGEESGTLFFFNICYSEFMQSKKKVPSELFEPRRIIGAAHGWVATLNNGVFSLQDDLNLYTLDPNPKQISMPPLVTLPGCQTQVVTNVSMSSSSPEDDDCIVAVKFSGPQLSLCRPAHDSSWTNIRITDPMFFTSRVMFSTRNQMFTLLASGGHHTGSWDLHKHKLQKLHFQDFPFTKTRADIIDSTYCTQHLVETSGGEAFLVKWYVHSTKDDARNVKTRGLMVFKIDQDGNAVFTQDIGDLNIFISKAEPFCLSASSYPGLDPNEVYFVDYDEIGVIDPSEPTNTSTVNPALTSAPYFFPPQKVDSGLDFGIERAALFN
ncbi:hypothetical protein YC2023_083103 [Brassica napus]